MAQRKPMSQTQILRKLAEEHELPLKQIKAIFASLSELAQTELNLKSRVAPHKFTIPGIVRLRAVKKPARKARKGINPFTGEETTFKAKPASVNVRCAAIKKFKDAVQ